MMNLAEIRKKAQRQRMEPDTVPELAEDDVHAIGESPAAEPAGQPAPVPEAGPVTGEPCETASAEKPGGEEQPAAELPFDPRALILAGRLSAGSAADFSEASENNPADVEEGVEKYLSFRVADEEYGVSLMDIREIIKARPVTEVPRMPRFVAGVLSLRGTIIPVFDLRLRLGFEPGEPTGLERIIIIKGDEGASGLLVDEVHQVVVLQSSAIKDAPQVLDGVDREFVMGIGRHGGRMLILLDLEKVMEVSLL